MIKDSELDDEFRFEVNAYLDGKKDEVKDRLKKPTRQEQRRGFSGLLEWAARVAEDNESDKVVVSVRQKDDGEKWHRLMWVELNVTEGFIKVKGEFPQIII